MQYFRATISYLYHLSFSAGGHTSGPQLAQSSQSLDNVVKDSLPYLKLNDSHHHKDCPSIAGQSGTPDNIILSILNTRQYQIVHISYQIILDCLYQLQDNMSLSILVSMHFLYIRNLNEGGTWQVCPTNQGNDHDGGQDDSVLIHIL